MPERFDQKWIRVAIYYAIAVAFSYLSRVYWGMAGLPDPRLGVWGVYLHLLAGVGPFLGALVIWFVFRPPGRRLSFGGTFLPMGLAMLAVPAVVFGIIGVANRFGIDPHAFGVAIGIWISLYAVLEETGWRGYLQQEFREQPALMRYAIVGLFWYPWHLTFVLGHNPIGTEISNLIFLVLASVGIGFVADRTKSIFAASAFHIIGNILLTSAAFKIFIPAMSDRMTIVLICAVIWLVMLRLWAMRDKRLRTAARPQAADAVNAPM